MRKRGNIGQAVIMGIESYAEGDFLKLLNQRNTMLSGVLFANVALIHSAYKASEIAGITGNQVEFVPNVNIKTGMRVGYNNFKASLQYSYLSNQFSEATNARDGGVSAVVGLIPAYYVMDTSFSYQFNKFKVEGNINNFTNNMYFTRRATGYPGPGILPSDGRSFYVTLQVKI